MEKETRGAHLAAVESTELKLGLDTFEGESDECLDTAGGGTCEEGSDGLFLGFSSCLGGHFANGRCGMGCWMEIKKKIYIKRNGGERLEVEVVRVEWVCLQLNGIYPYSYLYLVFLFAL